MNYAGSTSVRQPVPELSERDFSVMTGPVETMQGRGNSGAHLQFLREHRRVLARFALYGLFASTLLAFLIPARFESTRRLMSPDGNQSGGLATAAAARGCEVNAYYGGETSFCKAD